MVEFSKTDICSWIGDNEGCKCIVVYGKSYCERHYERMYTSFLPEMADYVIEKELKLRIE